MHRKKENDGEENNGRGVIDLISTGKMCLLTSSSPVGNRLFTLQ